MSNLKLHCNQQGICIMVEKNLKSAYQGQDPEGSTGSTQPACRAAKDKSNSNVKKVKIFYQASLPITFNCYLYFT